MARTMSELGHVHMSVLQKMVQLNWAMVGLVCVIAGIGFAMLYAAAGGSLDPWATRQMIRFALGLVIMFTIAVIDLRFWLRIAYPAFGLSLALLIGVEIAGSIGMGAQRWIDLGVIQLQPSELAKIALVMALARYFHGLTLEDVGRITVLVPPLLMVGVPAILVLRQPDLGTAAMLVFGSVTIFFLAGVRWWKFVLVGAGALAAIPVGWQFLLDYQKNRILTFIDPSRDPLGAGYHITQSKIALGAGGLFGKGFMQGSQSHLNFLPEKQTDFIFTMLAEEFGLVGTTGLLVLYGLLIGYGVACAMRARSQFGRLMAMGLTATLFLYVFCNVAMVMGVIPVVGVPLPLISYGGTAMLTILVAVGLMMSVYVHRDIDIARRPRGED